MLKDWSHKVRAILKEYCPGNIKKILPSSQSAWNTRFYFGHQKLCMDNNTINLIPVTLSKPGTTSATSPSLSGALIDVIIPPYVIISTVTLLVFFNVYLKKFTIIPNVYIYDSER